MSAPIPVLCVVGPPKKAKSDLIAGILKELGCQNLRVGVIKRHAHPGFKIDSEGKDSYRYYHAGADGVAISAPDKVAFISRREKEMPLEEVALNFFPGMDVVLADGYATSSAPRIIVCTSPTDAKKFEGDGEVVALVDASEEVGNFEEDFTELARILMEYFGL